MKRCWFGLGLLVVLLILSLFFSRKIGRNQEDILSDLRSSQVAALAEDYATAETLLCRARTDWEQRWHFHAAFSDHNPMEEIDGMFAQSQVYLDCRDGEELAALISQLIRRVQAVGDAHALTWWNLL